MPKSFSPIPHPTRKKDARREARIRDEIIVDAHDEEEMFMSWYYYLQETLAFPFQAYVRMENPEQARLSVLVTVLRMADIRFCCARCMWLMAHVKQSGWYIHIPASEIVEVKSGIPTVQALADWKYWIR